MSDCTALCAQVREAVLGFDLESARLGVARLVNCLGREGDALTDDAARDLLERLLDKRWFDVAESLAEPLLRVGLSSPELRRRCAQALLERGRYTAALEILLALRRSRRGDQAEVLGHIGRIRKQQYVESVRLGEPDLRLLELATRTYLDAYKEDRTARTWHGINAVALMRHGEDRAAGIAEENPGALAAEIMNTVRGLAAPRYWDLGTAAEAALALGDYDAAADWTRRYVVDANAFAVGATLRQLEEIWRLGDLGDPAASALLDLLRAALLQKTHGTLQMEGTDIARALQAAPAQMEAVFGADLFDSLENYRRGLERCACVARIGRAADTGAGTGFVLLAGLLGLPLGEEMVLVTNAHVLSEQDAERNRAALHPAEAVATFAALPGVPAEQEFGIGDVLFSSPREKLDTTVARLSPALSAVPHYPLAPVLPARDSKAQVRVIGHPSGRGLSFSVNELLDHESPRVHYRTATEGGSSGSPVFNREWKLIALHHAGGQAVPKLNGQDGSYQANEGIWIGAIRQAIEQERKGNT